MLAAAAMAMASSTSSAVLPGTGFLKSSVTLETEKKWIMCGCALVGIALQWPLRKRPERPDSEIAARFKAALPLCGDLAAGVSFAFALAISGMTLPSKVLGFVEPTRQEGWDPTLAFVMGGALAVSFPTIQLFGLVDKAQPYVPQWANRQLHVRHVLGGLIFGAGWGLSGICPMPALTTTGAAIVLNADPKYCIFGSGMLVSASASKLLEDFIIRRKQYMVGDLPEKEPQSTSSDVAPRVESDT